MLHELQSQTVCHFPVLNRRIILMSPKWMMLISPQFLLGDLNFFYLPS